MGVLPRTARAADATKAECASAYERSQELRVGGKLRMADEALSVCAQEACPAFVRSDCAQWITEVTRDIPTVIFSVTDKQGEAVSAVHVTMDGADLLSELDGKSVPLDPGTHRFQFEIEGAAPLTDQFSIRKGEKDRVINVTFAPRTTEAPPSTPDSAAPKDAGTESPSPEQSGKPGPLRPYAFVAGGVGAAGIIGFIAFGALGHSKQSDLNTSCGPTHTCSQSDVDGIKTKYLLADISLGVGIAGLGTGVALFILSQPKGSAPKSEDAAAHFDVRTVRDGALATVSGRF